MPVIKLSKKTIAAIDTPDRPTVFFDSDLKGFGLAVRPSGARSWVVEFRPGGGGRGMAKKRIVIGDPASMLPDQARAAAKSILARVAMGEDPAGERSEARRAATVEQLADRWLKEHVRPKRKPATADGYDHILRTHILPALGTRRAVTLTRADVARLHNDVGSPRRSPAKPGAKRSAELRTKGGKVIANRTVEVLSALLTWAAEIAGALPDDFKNPCRKVEAFRETGRERFLTPEEMQRLGEVLTQAETAGLPWREQEAPSKHTPKRPESRTVRITPHVAAAFRLYLLTGMRLRELLNLEWKNVDLTRGLLFLSDSKVGKRAVLLNAPAVAILAGLERLGKYVVASETAGTKAEAPRRDLNRPWRAIRRVAGMPDLRIHDCRHSFASTGVMAGLGLPEVGRLLGQTQPSTTMRYSHFGETAERRASNIVGAEVAAALGLPGAEVVDLAAARKRA